MHDGGGNRSQTIEALPGIIGEYRDAGYRFVTIEEYFELLSN
jgi:chitin deacetylase